MTNPLLQFELVLPCYNESNSLRHILERTIDAAQSLNFSSDQFQLVLVENGSKDDSSAVMDQLKGSPLGPWFRKVEVIHNQGYGFGLIRGLATTTAPIIGWSHADQQCDPKDAFSAFNALKRASSHRILIKGVRYDRNCKDKVVSRIFEGIARVVLGLKVHEINAQPKVFRRELWNEVPNPPYTFAFDLYVLYRAAKMGYQFQTLPVSFPPRVHGVSNWTSTFLGRYKTILSMIKYMWKLAHTEGRV